MRFKSGIVLLATVGMTVTGCSETALETIEPAPTLSPRHTASDIPQAYPNATSDPNTWPTEIKSASTDLTLYHTVMNLGAEASVAGTNWRLTPALDIEYRMPNGSYEVVKPTLMVEEGYNETSSLTTRAWKHWGNIPARADVCLTARATVGFRVWMFFGGTEWFVKSASRSDTESRGCEQTSCVDKSDAEITFAAYDPYGSGDASADCSEGDGSGGDGGDGTQYNPGDQTNGETVDWSTGKGTGSPSSCPDAAPTVEYMCFEFEWTTESGETKRETRCGYVTVCG